MQPHLPEQSGIAQAGRPARSDVDSPGDAPERVGGVAGARGGGAGERFPLFNKAGLKSVISGAITHTPDGACLSGPAPGAPNYWMHCGASIGIAQGAGAGIRLVEKRGGRSGDYRAKE